jgi:hypothetical protein
VYRATSVRDRVRKESSRGRAEQSRAAAFGASQALGEPDRLDHTGLASFEWLASPLVNFGRAEIGQNLSYKGRKPPVDPASPSWYYAEFTPWSKVSSLGFVRAHELQAPPVPAAPEIRAWELA